MPTDAEVSALATRLRCLIGDHIPSDVLMRHFAGDGYMLMARFPSYAAALPLADRADRYLAADGGARYLEPSIVSELLAGKFMVDRQTTELMMALDPTVLNTLSPRDPEQHAVCVAIKNPDGSETLSWCHLRRARAVPLPPTAEELAQQAAARPAVFGELARRIQRIENPLADMDASHAQILKPDRCHRCHKTAEQACQEEAPLQLCAKCRFVAYCCRDCQGADCQVHKRLCKEFGRLRDSVDLQRHAQVAQPLQHSCPRPAGAAHQPPT